MLWLNLYLPALSLEVFERGIPPSTPLAVVERQRVLIANALARDEGITPGMRLPAAQTLVPHLCIQERRPESERRALDQLAGWALQFTPMVSPQPPYALLLEIGSSLRLFGGLDNLLGKIRQNIRELGYRPLTSVAPTATGALLLGRGGDEHPAADSTAAQRQIKALPFTVLDLDRKQADALGGLGLRTLGDCLALPREGLSRRVGPTLMTQLDRAFGRLAEPRQPYVPAPVFADHLDLPAEINNTEALVFGLQRQLRELCGFLRGLDAGIQRMSLRLYHRDIPATRLRVGLLSPSRDPGRLLELARQRLERVCLPASVISMTLETRDILPLGPDSANLLDGQADRQSHWNLLIERLCARLGHQTINGLQTRSEHRPERAWDYAPPGQTGPAEPNPERPLWLLPRPLPLTKAGSQPCWDGPLVLQKGPERIESGWWDGEDVSRDYYVAQTPHGTRIWIFRERRGRRHWFIHGIFA